MMAEPKPKKSPVDAKTTLIGVPIPCDQGGDRSRFSRVVIAVITEVSPDCHVVVARRLKRLVS